MSQAQPMDNLTDEEKSKILTQLANTSSVHGIDLSNPQLDESRPPKAIQGEDGNYYLNNEYVDASGQWQTNPDYNTPVYFFHQPLEVGNAYGNYAEYSEDLTSATKQGNWMTEEQVKGYWEGTFDTGSINMDVFKDQHPDMTFDQYMSYLNDNTQLHGQGYTIEDNPEMFSALTDQYGINTSFQGDTGHMWGWNGSNYEKTYHADKHTPVGDMLFSAALGAVSAGALAPVIGGLTGAAPAGFVGPMSAGQVLGGNIATGLAAGAGSAASQGLLTGKIDPGSVLSSALIAGVNPGGWAADNIAPWYGPDNVTGDLGWQLGGAGPSTFYGGLISGTVNDVVSTGLTEGEFDLASSLEKGLISGGINSALNTWDEWNNNSQEGIADQLQHQDPYAYPNTEAGRAAAMAEALNSDLLNTTDFGAIIGEGGLLPFIPRADLGFIRSITDPIGEGVDGLLNGFDLQDYVILPDGTKVPKENYTDAELANLMMSGGDYSVESNSTMGLLNNPIVNGAADLLGSLLPSGSGLSENLQSQKDQYDTEWSSLYTQASDPDYYQADGVTLTVAGMDARNDFTQLKMDTLASFYFNNSGGLNENYSWSSNPRGDSELWGTMVGLPGLYSTGGQTSYLPDGQAGTVTPPLNPDGTPVTPITNLGPEFVNPDGYAEADPASAILPSNDDAALRNWWLQQYYSYINQDTTAAGSDASADLGVTTDVADTGANATSSGDAATDSNQTTVNTDVTNTDVANTDVANTGGADVTTNADGGTDTGGSTLDGSSAGTTVASNSNVTPIYGLTINDNGTVTLPGGSTVSADIADSVYETILKDNESTLPAGGGGGGGSGGNLGGGRSGLPPTWTELFGYSKISPYKKARLKVLDGMLSGIMGSQVGNMNEFAFGPSGNSYQKIGKDLIDAGMEPRT
jgi:hypothetical protein